MKRKINIYVSLILCILMLFPFATLTISADEPEYVQEVKFVEDGEMGGIKYGHYEDPNEPEVSSKKQVKQNKVSAANYPSSYSSVDEGYEVPIEDQELTKNCWAYSLLATIGIYNRKNYGISADDANYSEAHLNYFKCISPDDTSDPLYGDGPNHFTCSSGEYVFTGPSILLRGTGLIKQSDLPECSTTTNPAYSETLRYNHSAGLLTSAEEITMATISDITASELTTSISMVKEKIMENGAVNCSVYVDNTCFYRSVNGYSYYSGLTEKHYTNHAITVVGWDDNYSKENFSSSLQPENDGAWLCRNSWGTSFGNSGYFWVAYDENISNIFTYTAVPADTYDKIYQYNGYNSFSTYSYFPLDDTRTAKQACIYTADECNILEAINYFTISACKVKVSIYTNVEAGKPESGTLSYQKTYDASCMGYHFFELSNPLSVEDGTKYSVVTQLYAADGEEKYAFPSYTISETSTNNPENTVTNEGESFYYNSGVGMKDWADGMVGYTYPQGETSKTVGVGDALIKVYATEEKELEFTEESNITLSAGNDYQLSFKSTDNIKSLIAFSSNNENVATVDSEGKISAISCGSATITITAGNLSDTISITVPHNYGSFVTVKEPTCTEKGSRVKTCSVCLNSVNEEINATGHSFGEWVTVTHSTVLEEGVSERECTICHEKETEAIPKIEAGIIIRNYESKITVGYRTSVRLYADAYNNNGCVIKWYDEDGTFVCEGNTLYLNKLEKTETVYAKLTMDGKTVAYSNKMTVVVKTGFFDKVKWFFLNLFDSPKLVVDRG